MCEEMNGRLFVKGDCNGKQCCINRCSIFNGVVFWESFDIYGAKILVIWCSACSWCLACLRLAYQEVPRGLVEWGFVFLLALRIVLRASRYTIWWAW